MRLGGGVGWDVNVHLNLRQQLMLYKLVSHVSGDDDDDDDGDDDADADADVMMM